jgi:hypothetical protein
MLKNAAVDARGRSSVIGPTCRAWPTSGEKSRAPVAIPSTDADRRVPCGVRLDAVHAPKCDERDHNRKAGQYTLLSWRVVEPPDYCQLPALDSV